MPWTLRCLPYLRVGRVGLRELGRVDSSNRMPRLPQVRGPAEEPRRTPPTTLVGQPRSRAKASLGPPIGAHSDWLRRTVPRSVPARSVERWRFPHYFRGRRIPTNRRPRNDRIAFPQVPSPRKLPSAVRWPSGRRQRFAKLNRIPSSSDETGQNSRFPVKIPGSIGERLEQPIEHRAAATHA